MEHRVVEGHGVAVEHRVVEEGPGAVVGARRAVVGFPADVAAFRAAAEISGGSAAEC